MDATVALGPEGAITPSTRALFTNDGAAWLVGSPEVITTDAPDLVALSPDGKAVLIAVTHRPPYRGPVIDASDIPPLAAELDLVYWDGRTRQAKTIYREAADAAETPPTAMGIVWLPDTRIALVTLSRGGETAPRTLLRVDAAAGTAHRLTDLGPLEYLEISPTQPIAVIETMADASNDPPGAPFPDRTFRAVTPAGIGPPFTVPGDSLALRWSADGAHLFSSYSWVRNSTGRISRRPAITVVDLQSASVSHPTEAPAAADGVSLPGATPEEPLPFRETVGSQRSVPGVGPAGLRLTTDTLTLSGTAPDADLRIRGIWLEAKGMAPIFPPNVGRPRLLLAAGSARPAALLGDGSAALFVRDGTLCAVPIFRLEVAVFVEALRRVQRTGAIQNAKKIALAMIQYAQDYDENFPANHPDIESTIQPYLEEPGTFEDPSTGQDGFTYSYVGTTEMAHIADPAATQLGYVVGPGGRAVLFADGHVKWQDDGASAPPGAE
jgi:prepilin-type processing-associated H-X9-DG protein